MDPGNAKPSSHSMTRRRKPCNKARMEQLKELAKEYPNAVKITRDEDWCMEADMPKKWVKIKPPRKLTEEQYAELVRRGKELAERQRQAKNLVKE